MWKPSIDYDAVFFKSQSRRLAAGDSTGGWRGGCAVIRVGICMRTAIGDLNGLSISGERECSAKWQRGPRFYGRTVSMMAAVMAIRTTPRDSARHPDSPPRPSLQYLPDHRLARTIPYCRETPQSIWCHMRMGRCSAGCFSLDDVIGERRAY